MQLLRSSLTYHAESGRKTLQIPDYNIGEPAEPYAEFPDEWFCRLRDRVPAVGRQSGFLWLTRAGYEANRELLLVAYETSTTGRGDGRRETFEAAAQAHFAKVERYRDRAIGKLRRQLEQLEQTRV